MDQQPTIRLVAPEAELEALSFSNTDPADLREWIGSLPMANTAEAATQLRQATFEIGRLQCDFATRMALLEEVRPTLHYLCARLDRTAAANTSHSDAIARLNQRLQTNLCSGYKAAVLAAVSELETEKAGATVSLGIHRALSGLSRTLLRTLQFYVAPSNRLWLELNQLYLLAEYLGFEGDRWEDSENHSQQTTNLSEAYIRSVLLATCKPNQLRYSQLSRVFNAIEQWTASTSISNQSNGSLLSVDLDSDRGPTYARRLQDAKEPRSVHTQVLVYELEAYLKEIDSTIHVPDYIDTALLNHLVDSWGVMRQRAYRRAPAAGSLKVCVGLRNTHYFLSGGVEFSDQLESADAMLKREVNPFLEQSRNDNTISLNGMAPTQSRKDVWDDAFDLKVKISKDPQIEDPDRVLLQGYGRDKTEEAAANAAEGEGGVRYYDTTALDTSPAGYKIRWNEPLPTSVQTGEIAALRDASDPRWCIAVIRWISQDSDGTGMGVELISPRAIPVAVRAINKRSGPRDFTRALILPALEAINQPATLITPSVPFQAGQKIHIHRQGVQTTAQLTVCKLKTDSVCQFTFRMLDGYLENTQINIKMANQSAAGDLDTGDS